MCFKQGNVDLPLFFFFFKQKTAYEIGVRLVGSEMCIRDRAYITPLQFTKYKTVGLEKGFNIVESAPLVRSSYHAEKHIR